ncbi:electron transfer flavoprotein beta subunit lysine methyltransferase-like [Cimex lectularius]|uniref:ETFB lysine methyltransferase n=1 Tax=Cimex lectularius TaxID=79782 RepID=A0A8I6TK94_CIMLE|nr:electron transfer flavoprotein beta subunit lysine methyltransferase-like [Cimex lectularius]
MKLYKYGSLCLKRVNIRNGIAKHTEVTDDHMTPELKLRLITPRSPLWTDKPETCEFKNPFWAFYWAGGQALTRYILDHAEDFQGRYVLDLGSGCGASAIAAAKCNAKACFANDVDNVSCEAICMNAHMNGCRVHIIQKNIIAKKIQFKFDYVLVGDMFYDPFFASKLFSWLEMCKSKGADVLIGDPGRYALAKNFRKSLKLIEEYQLPLKYAAENNGFTSSAVWRL